LTARIRASQTIILCAEPISLSLSLSISLSNVGIVFNYTDYSHPSLPYLYSNVLYACTNNIKYRHSYDFICAGQRVSNQILYTRVLCLYALSPAKYIYIYNIYMYRCACPVSSSDELLYSNSDANNNNILWVQQCVQQKFREHN